MIDKDIMITVLKERNSDLHKLVKVQDAEIATYMEQAKAYEALVQHYKEQIGNLTDSASIHEQLVQVLRTHIDRLHTTIDKLEGRPPDENNDKVS